MKRSTKIITIVTSFFLIIAIVITARTMIGNHFKKKFSKIPPPGIIVTNAINEQFSEKLETFGTAISSKSKTFKIRKDDVQGELDLKNKDYLDYFFINGYLRNSLSSIQEEATSFANFRIISIY